MEKLKESGVRGLRWLEKYTKTDMVYLAQGGFWLNANQAVGVVFGLALTIAFANLIPIETYGIYRYVLSIYSLFVIVSLPGINTALLRSISHHMDGSFVKGIKTKIKWGFLGSVVSLLFAGYKYLNDDQTLGIIFLLIAILFPLVEAFTLYTPLLNGKKLFREWAIIDALIQVFSIISLLLVLFFTQNIFFIILGYFIPLIIGRVSATFFVKKKYIENEPSDPELFPYGKSLTIYQIVTRIISSIDQIVLFHFLGPSQVAIFSLATAIPNRIQSLFRATGTLAFPKFTEKSKEASVNSLPKKMLWMALVIFVVCILYVIFAPYIFKYVFPKYLSSLEYSKIVVFYTLSAITYPFSSYMLAHKKIKENYIFGITNLTVKIVVLAIFVPLFGIWGAIASILGTSLVTIILSVILINREKTNLSVL